MATYETTQQLSFAFDPEHGEPTIADASNVVHFRRSDPQKLPADLSDAELLTTLVGPRLALSCEWLITKATRSAHDRNAVPE